MTSPRLVDEEVPALESPEKQWLIDTTYENSSERALKYNARATATQGSTKIKDGNIEKHRQHFTCVIHPHSHTACHQKVPLSCDVPLWRKKRAEDSSSFHHQGPRQPSWLSGTLKVLPLRTPSVFAYANLSWWNFPESMPLSTPEKQPVLWQPQQSWPNAWPPTPSMVRY